MEHDDTTVNNNKSTLPPGTLLKNKRESLGYSKQDVASRLRLRIAIINSIEGNEFESDQVATFTRGYLRSYAKAVGMSDAEILESYEEHCKVADAEPESMQSFSKQTKRDKNDNRLMTLTWVILLVIIGMSSLWWYQNSQQDTLSPQSNSTKSSIPSVSEIKKAAVDEEFNTVSDLTNPSVDNQAVQESQEPKEDAQQESTAAEQSSSDDSIDKSQAAAPTASKSTQSTEQATPNTSLSMRFIADCWIQIKDATGKTLAIGIKKKGQSLDVSGNKPFKVVLGAPEAVQMSLGDESVDLSGYTSGKVARLTLP
ncbi:cytoskeleton protein RodZ [Vibrio palustris]|uniref:Cytoskeleton protein RodZ n=1 Tax=Vibrio palustris TaxID=1918946 RepID=A0A1R4B8H1_9VIBR|nr:cytoskeleton protein RodZ [Vibrio palustris]SJL85151.1 Cytoskeleton protein RodZ [Vibrio palustris]